MLFENKGYNKKYIEIYEGEIFLDSVDVNHPYIFLVGDV